MHKSVLEWTSLTVTMKLAGLCGVWLFGMHSLTDETVNYYGGKATNSLDSGLLQTQDWSHTILFLPS